VFGDVAGCLRQTLPALTPPSECTAAAAESSFMFMHLGLTLAEAALFQHLLTLFGSKLHPREEVELIQPP